MEKNVIVNGAFKQTKRFSAIFFDLDNTLIPTRKADAKTCNKISGILQMNHNIEAGIANNITSTFLEEFRKCPDNVDIPLDVWRQHLWNRALTNKYQHLSHEIYRKWLDLRYKYLEISSETLSLLRYLRQNFYLAIITNGTSNAQWEKIRRLNLGDLFDCIVVSGDMEWEKPDERIFFAACDYLKVKPIDCIMIGDKLDTDMEGAIEAKLGGSIWIPLNGDTAGTSGSLISPDYTISDLQELLKILKPDNDHKWNNPAIKRLRTELDDNEDSNGSIN